MYGTPFSQFSSASTSERARADVRSLYAAQDALPLPADEAPTVRPSLRTWLGTMRRRAGLARA